MEDSDRAQEIERRYSVKGRIALFFLIFAFGAAILTARLYQLQITQGEELAEKTEAQYMRSVVTAPARGQIYSADGQVLAGNVARYDLVMHPSQMRNPRGILITSDNMLKIITDLEEHVLHRKSTVADINALRRHMNQDMAQPIVIFPDLTDEEIARCEELMPMTQGISVTPRIERCHPFPGMATHLLGMTNWRRMQLPRKAYSIREIHGVDGLEARYDQELSGKTGVRTIIKDPSGFIRDEMPGATEKINGYDLKLTIDSRAQASAEAALDGFRGALVAMDVRSGAVIAMASAPSYSLEGMTKAYYAELLADKENKPLFNRAAQGKYMPGSIVKPLIAMAALENGIASPEDEYECIGYYSIGAARIHCARRRGHGPLDITHAIAVSCNPFFINLGIKCKLDILEAAYSSAGFGVSTGFDLPDSAGTIPSRKTARRLWNRNWLMIDSAYASLGQGAVEVTPLQVASYAAAIANGGKLWRPYVMAQILQPDGSVVKETMPVLRGRLPFSEESMAVARMGMTMAVNEPGASAAHMRNACVPLAAKTGTAEVGSKDTRHKNTWLICYGPLPEPSFAVACVVENGASGGGTTAPVVVDFINGWLGDAAPATEAAQARTEQHN